MFNNTSKMRVLAAAMVVGLAVPAMAKKAAKKTEKKTTTAEVKKIEVDTTTSQVKWLGKKVTGQHDGTIALKSGEFEVAGKDLKGGTFVIDMTSIKNTDITDAKSNKKLVGHLSGEDFFDAPKFPTSTIKITTVKALAKPDAAKNTHEITGDVTIKGVTQAITFPAIVEVKDNTVHAKATVVVDRTKFGVKYGSGKFFEGLGDKVINDEFTLDIDVKSKETAKVAQQ